MIFVPKKQCSPKKKKQRWSPSLRIFLGFLTNRRGKALKVGIVPPNMRRIVSLYIQRVFCCDSKVLKINLFNFIFKKGSSILNYQVVAILEASTKDLNSGKIFHNDANVSLLFAGKLWYQGAMLRTSELQTSYSRRC